MYFTYDGKLIKSIKYPEHIQSIDILNDGKYLVSNIGTSSDIKYNFRLTNERNDSISVVRNYISWVNTSFIASNYPHPYFYPSYYLGNNFYFKSLYNDTVYTITSNTIKPYYYVNLGKFKIPENLIPERISGTDLMKEFKEKEENFCFANVLEASNMIYFAAYSFANVTPKYFLYDKLKNKGVYLNNINDKSTGIVNDWDGGCDFWPTAHVNENKIYMPIDIMKFQKGLKQKIDIREPVRFPDKQDQLYKTISGYDILDNPIIMVVTLKSNN